MQNGFNCTNIAGGYTLYPALFKDKNAETKDIGDCGLSICIGLASFIELINYLISPIQ